MKIYKNIDEAKQAAVEFIKRLITLEEEFGADFDDDCSECGYYFKYYDTDGTVRNCYH